MKICRTISRRGIGTGKDCVAVGLIENVSFKVPEAAFAILCLPALLELDL